MPRRLVGGWLNDGWDGEPPIRRAVRPDQTRGESRHTQPRERIRREVEAIGKGADARGTLALHRVSDSREEGLQPSLLVTGRQRDAVSEHRGLSSGVASGKSVGSH
jgi:hypothetical protein